MSGLFPLKESQQIWAALRWRHWTLQASLPEEPPDRGDGFHLVFLAIRRRASTIVVGMYHREKKIGRRREENDCRRIVVKLRDPMQM